MKLIPGDKIAEKIKSNIKSQLNEKGAHPTIAIIYAGQNASSEIYINKKIQAAKEVGIDVEIKRFFEISEEELIKVVKNLNQDERIDGYFLQLPLQENISTKRILAEIDPQKDIDGLSPISLGHLWHGSQEYFISATAIAVMRCLEYISIFQDGTYDSQDLKKDTNDLFKTSKNLLSSKQILIINDSILVGKPLSAILNQNNATVIMANKFTPRDKLEELTQQSDIIITATGKSGLITNSLIRDSQIIIDVGIEKSQDKVQGDVNTEMLETKDIWLSPVPNGVGPITVACLLENALKASLKK